jgi:ethanolamine ammonia-lyase large subunit
MPVTLDDLDWCIDQIMPANPGYLMALPTKNDPMLSYLTTAFQDHVRVREKFGFKVDDALWDFYKKLGVIDANGNPTEHFGDPIWVYYKYLEAKGDKRSKDEIYAEGKKKMEEIAARGVPLSVGYGENVWDLNPELDKQIHALYDDAKVSLWAELTPEFIKSVPNVVSVKTQSADREDYIAHPNTGEELSEAAVATLEKMQAGWGDKAPDVQIVISDGLNARAIMDDGHLEPYLDELRKELEAQGFKAANENVVVTSGRVRAGYRIGELLFGTNSQDVPKGIVHIIGERPGSGHHNFSAYITTPTAKKWNEKDLVDHDVTKVVSGISDTALDPKKAAKQTVELLKELTES